MVRTIDDYVLEEVEASKSALIELMVVLHSYSDSLVLIGGWVPYFLLKKFQHPSNKFNHIGSIDIDIAINPEGIDAEAYATIVELISGRGYQNKKYPSGDTSLYSFEKSIPSPISDKEYMIKVDFLTPQPNILTGKHHRHRKVQPDLRARMTRGCEVVFRHNMEYELSGVLPKNGETSVKFKMADIVGSLSTKGIALGEAYREKDAYDIYALIANYKEGPADVAREVKPWLAELLVLEGIKNIKGKFRDIKAEGPSWVASFLYPHAGEKGAKERAKADAFMFIKKFVEVMDKQTSAPVV